MALLLTMDNANIVVDILKIVKDALVLQTVLYVMEDIIGKMGDVGVVPI